MRHILILGNIITMDEKRPFGKAVVMPKLPKTFDCIHNTLIL